MMSVRNRIVDHIRVHGGKTKADLMTELGESHQTVTGRLSDLHRDGILEYRDATPLDGDRPSHVYVLAASGKPRTYADFTTAIAAFSTALSKAGYTDAGRANKVNQVRSICRGNLPSRVEAFQNLETHNLKESSEGLYRFSLGLFYDWLEGGRIPAVRNERRHRRTVQAIPTPAREAILAQHRPVYSLAEARHYSADVAQAFRALDDAFARAQAEGWQSTSRTAASLLLDKLSTRLT